MTELWLVDVERSETALASLERDTPRLTPQDRRRTAAIKDPQDRRRRLAITTALRVLLERAAGARASRQPFIMAAGGKPRLADGGVAFSLSHVDGYALIGLTRLGRIGVDLEQERAFRISTRRRDELMAAAEGLAGRRVAGASPDARFLQAWCRLEAFAKARGWGIGRTLADLGLRSGHARTLAEVQDAASRRARDAGLIVRDLPLASGLFAAIALERACRLQTLWLPADCSGLVRLLVTPFGAAPAQQLTRTRRRGTRSRSGA